MNTLLKTAPANHRLNEMAITIKNVFILGNHIQSLGLSRMAAKTGRRVTVFNDYGASVARFSNSCHAFRIFKDEDHLLQMLLEEKGSKDTLLVATNDKLIGFMANHYGRLSKQFFLSIPKPESVQICFNKRDTYTKAMQLGMPIPETHFPDSLDDLEDLASRIKFPVILKPAIMFTFYKATGKKAYLCNNREELINNYNLITSVIPPKEVIVQQFLTGGAKTLYSFGSFFAEGEVYGGLVARRIRQKPMDFGISTCFAHTVINPEIEKLATSFLKAIDYFGMSEVEFMYEEETRTFNLIEINPRSWKWHSIANKLDIDLLGMMINFLEGKPVQKKMNDKADIGWIERLTDTFVVMGEIAKGRMSISEYIKTLRMPKESAAWSINDPLPAIMYILMSPFLFLKRSIGSEQKK